MDHTGSTDNQALGAYEPESVRFTTDYVKRLLIERHHVYAKLYNHGGSIILTATARIDEERAQEYNSAIGSSFHLDLIELELELERSIRAKEWSKREIQALLTWIDGMSSQQAAVYLHARGAVAIRKRRERGLKKITDLMNAKIESMPSVRDEGSLAMRSVPDIDERVPTLRNKSPGYGDNGPEDGDERTQSGTPFHRDRKR